MVITLEEAIAELKRIGPVYDAACEAHDHLVCEVRMVPMPDDRRPLSQLVHVVRAARAVNPAVGPHESPGSHEHTDWASLESE